MYVFLPLCALCSALLRSALIGSVTFLFFLDILSPELIFTRGFSNALGIQFAHAICAGDAGLHVIDCVHKQCEHSERVSHLEACKCYAYVYRSCFPAP